MNKKKYILIIIICLVILGISTFLIMKKYSIKKITIGYYPRYDLGAEHFDIVDKVNLELTGEDFEKVKKYMNGIFYAKLSDELEYIEEYEIVINDKDIYYIGYGYGNHNNKDFYVDKQLCNYIHQLTEDYNNKNIYKKFEASNVTIEYNDQVIEAKDYIKNHILGFKYMNLKTDVLSEEEPKMCVNMDNKKLYLYDSGIVAKVDDGLTKTTIVLIPVDSSDESMFDFIENHLSLNW